MKTEKNRLGKRQNGKAGEGKWKGVERAGKEVLFLFIFSHPSIPPLQPEEACTSVIPNGTGNTKYNGNEHNKNKKKGRGEKNECILYH